MTEKQLLVNIKYAMSKGQETIFIPNLKASLILHKKVVTGKTYRSIYEYSEIQGFYVISGTYSTNDLVFKAMYGRKAGKMPPVASLEEWARITGVSAWGTAVNIKNKGTNPLNHKPFLIDETVGKSKGEIIDYVGTACNPLIELYTYEKILQSWH